LRIVFNLNVNAELSAKESLEKLDQVAGFLEKFEADNQHSINGDVYVVCMEDTEDQDKVSHVENIQKIKIRVGVAQQFQTEFNAEFN
jgi:predicted ThiF/HesA family dinucleotide-utilizing enzyme